MATLIGENIDPVLNNQIKIRQLTHGKTSRTSDDLLVLNANNSWIKLASGVSISSSRLKKAKLDTSLDGMDLAKKYVLFGGTSKYSSGNLIQKQGIDSYEFSEFGFVPMPGIDNISVKSLNRGAIRKATIILTAHSKEQFEIINLLYMHLGYTVLLEWGNTFYLNNSSELKQVHNTLIEDKFFNITNGSYSDLLDPLENYRKKYHYNCDGMLGKIQNYSWSFKKDGSYEIELNLVSMGDVVESLKTNISIDKSLSSFLANFNQNQETTGAPPAIENNKNESLLSSYLFLYQFIDSEDTKNNVTRPDITINNGDKVGIFLNNGSSTLVTNSKTYKFTKYSPSGTNPTSDGTQTFNSVDPERDAIDELFKRYLAKSTSTVKKTKDQSTTSGNMISYQDDPFGVGTGILVVSMEEVSTTSPSTTINNPINNDPPKVAIKINATTPQYFIKMEYVLNFLKNKIIPNIKSSPPVPLVDIITNRTSNIMYCIGDIHISLDPRVCIVRNDGFRELDTPSGILVSKAYPELDEWRDSSNKNKAYLNNIYLNFSFVISCLESSQDEKGNSNLFQFLKALCDGLNKALGGVNNLEPTINENKNQIRIIDTTPIPNSTPSSTMEDFVLFGYDGAKSNFVRKLDIKTAVPPEMATMISVGVTSGGYVKGVEATAFAKWNKGIEDRFKVEFIPPNVSSSIDAHDEVIENYKENFVQNDAGAYGLDAIAEPRTFTDSVITKNLSTVTEYYRYIFSTFKNSGGAVGFIPFKLNFTIDGISGFKIYNKVLANLKFLSKDYQNFLNFIVTEINHKVSNHDWETELSCVLHPNTEKISPKIVKSKQIVNAARTPPTPVAVYGTGTPTNYTGEGWEPLITLITTGESKTGGYDALNPSTTFTAQHGKPFNQLTIQEAIDLAKKTREIKKATSRTPSLVTGAMGLYQQMPNPLPERVIRAGLSLSNLFDKAAQDKIAIEYNIKEKRPNLRKYCMGENAGNQDDLEKAIQAYGQEWASAPVCWTGLSVGSGTRIGDPNQLGSLGKGKFNQTGCYPRQKDSAYPVSDVVKVFMKVRKNLGGSKPTFIPSYINWDSL